MQNSMDQLQIKGASNASASFFPMTTDSFVVGRRSYCDLVLNDHTVSREHARFVREGGRWRVEDLQSRNGVWINGKRAGYEPVPIADGDVVLIGDETLVFHSDASSSEPKARSGGKRREPSEFRDDVLDPKSIRTQYSVAGGSSVFSDPVQDGFKTVSQYKKEVKLLEERVRVLLDFAKILGKAEDSRDLTPRFLDGLLRIFPNADSACVCALQPSSDCSENPQWRIVGYASRNEDDSQEFKASRAILQYVADSRVAVLSDSVSEDSRFEASQSAASARIQSVMAAPVYDSSTNRLRAAIQINSRKHRRRFVKNDLKLLVAVAGQVGVYWENQDRRDELMSQKLAVCEMQLANQMQRGFLPLEPPKIDSYEFFDYYRPAKFVGGDYFDYVPLSDGSWAIVLGDVAGKGMSASLLMAKLSSEVRYSLALEKSGSAAMARLNRVFSENRWGDRFITLATIILEPNVGVARIFNAGHLYPVALKANGATERIGEGYNSFPLGVVPDAEFPEFDYSLDEGDSIAIMSDGFPDAMNARQETFGDERVERSLRNATGEDATSLGRRLVRDVKDFSESCPQSDDQCLVVFRRVRSDASVGTSASVGSGRVSSKKRG